MYVPFAPRVDWNVTPFTSCALSSSERIWNHAVLRYSGAICSLNVTTMSDDGETLFSLFAGWMSSTRGGVASSFTRGSSIVPVAVSEMEKLEIVAPMVTSSGPTKPSEAIVPPTGMALN